MGTNELLRKNKKDPWCCWISPGVPRRVEPGVTKQFISTSTSVILRPSNIFYSFIHIHCTCVERGIIFFASVLINLTKLDQFNVPARRVNRAFLPWNKTHVTAIFTENANIFQELDMILLFQLGVVVFKWKLPVVLNAELVNLLELPFADFIGSIPERICRASVNTL